MKMKIKEGKVYRRMNGKEFIQVKEVTYSIDEIDSIVATRVCDSLYGAERTTSRMVWNEKLFKETFKELPRKLNDDLIREVLEEIGFHDTNPRITDNGWFKHQSNMISVGRVKDIVELINKKLFN